MEVEENEFALINIKKTVSDKLKEMQAFWDAMQELRSRMKYSSENKEEQEEEFWKTKAEYMPELKARFPEMFCKDKPELMSLQP